jgi:hypothetical protein
MNQNVQTGRKSSSPKATVLMLKHSEAHIAWSNRIKHAQGKFGIWMLTPKNTLTQAFVQRIDQIKMLMWAENEKELLDYLKWSLDPEDCDYRVLECNMRNGKKRCVYMAWKALDQSQEKNINIPATRILLENGMIDAPMIETMQEDLMRYTHIFPSDHCIFYQTVNEQLVSYPRIQILNDWYYFFPREIMPAYRRLASERYHHYSQALTEFENTGSINSFVKMIITHYMGRKVGPVQTWNLAQLAVLGAAMLLMYEKEWNFAITLPRCVR